jgi:hypothetical protein
MNWYEFLDCPYDKSELKWNISKMIATKALELFSFISQWWF